MQAVLTGLLFTSLTGLGMALILGLVLYFTPLSESMLPLMASIITALAVFLGGLQAARASASRGLIMGVSVSLLFFLLIIAVGWGSSLSPEAALKKLGLCLLAGAMGGVAGITGK